MQDDQDKENLPFLSPKDSPRSKKKAQDFSSPQASKIKSPQFNTPTHLIRGALSPTRTASLTGTPTRARSDIKIDARLRQIQLSHDRDIPVPDSVDKNIFEPRTDSKLVIWGTDVVLSDCKASVKKFLETFKPPSKIPQSEKGKRQKDSSEESIYYLQRIYEIEITRKPFLNLDAKHIMLFDMPLYRQLIRYPQEVIPALDAVANDLFFEKFKESVLEHQIRVRVFNTDRTKNMRALNPEDIDQLVNISGMIVRASNIMPELQEAFFQCYICKNNHVSEVVSGKVIEPNVCSNCNSSHTMILVHNLSQYGDKQVIKVQESPEEMPPGQTPYNVLLFAHADLVDAVQPGDRVTITGIYRVVPVKINPKQRMVKSVYRTFIDVIHFQKVDHSKIQPGESETKISEERIKEIVELSKDKDIYEKLAQSLAPSIYGNLDVKKGVLLQLFGASKKDFSHTGRSHFRSEINILLCGDPGTCKSQLLKYIHELLPRGQYTSGKGSSAVGLTAYVTRDPDTRQLVLQTGCLVLSDNGICCIDEFDKMSESTRSVLHEVMEQQTLSIAKAGIICQLNARTSILAAANPVRSKWDTRLTTIANIEMPHTLLSRFDLIFLILDHQSEAFDQNLARHLVSIYEQRPKDHLVELQRIDMALLKDYITYARMNFQPKLTEESAEHLIQSYLEMRRIGNQHGSISAYPRQLESLIRLSEAHAKLRLSHFVDVEDVVEALRLHKEALMQSSTDPRTGMIDVNILAAGFSESDRKVQNDVVKMIKTYLNSVVKSYTSHQYQQVLEMIRKTSPQSISAEVFDAALRSLEDDHIISMTDNKVIRYIQV